MDVERDRCRGKKSIGLAEFQELARREQEVDEVTVLDLDALRLARTTRREQDVRKLLSSGCTGRNRNSVRARPLT